MNFVVKSLFLVFPVSASHSLQAASPYWALPSG